tara:strand:- start:363 stop:677 length:315 start_codon:yes stop_codon:yes gene_type:complete
MYDIKSLIGKTVTVKLTSGVELITKLIGYVAKDKNVTCEYPMTIIISDGEVAAVPYQYTGNSSEVVFSINKILSICPTLAKPEEDYLLLVANSKEVDPETVETA